MTCPMRSGEPHSYEGIRTDRCYYCGEPRSQRESRAGAPVPLRPELMLVARCSVCGAPMFSEESLATGIGPKCRERQKKKNGLDPACKQEVQTVNDIPSRN